ncbi:hypothetical protein [Aeromonas salmonicida]|uniref:hypothetical protein n=1 Tax=Aeromonas salmonicida TaxID=645 RepID=UPI00223FEC39|nr:hypothetical protein [Aeromonas salmonicida]
MRIGLFLLLFPSLAFAIDGCPVGVQLGNVTMATSLPVCLKFDASKLGGCLVDCKSVCVELPLANTKGPVETTGSSCSWSDSNGSGNGDADGSGNTPGEGNNGGEVDGWDFFAPVVGDATGTSVSGSIAKINKNLGSTLGTLMGTADRTYHSLNEMRGLAQRETNATEKAVSVLEEIREYNKKVSSNAEGANLYLSRIEQAQEEANIYLKKLAESSGGTGTGSGSSGGDSGDGAKIYEELKQFHANTFGPDFAQNNEGGNMYALVNGLQYEVISMKDRVHTAASDIGNMYNYVLPDLRNNSIEMNRNIKAIAEAIKNGGIGGGDGSGGTGNGGEGQGIDYSKMPGSEQNPLHVAGANYNSNLCKNDAECFFDLAAVNKKYDDAKGKLADTYDGVKEEMADMFHYSFSGSAAVPKCFDMFSLYGRSYSICPEVEGYWEMLAAIMMFIFYFLALMIVAKR